MKPFQMLIAGAAIAALGGTFGSTAVAKQNPANECLVGVQQQSDADSGGSTIAASEVACTDGDASCDADGVADGTCTFRVRGCVNVADVAGCTARPIKKAKFVTKPTKNIIQLTPDAAAASSVCGSFVDLKVAIKQKKKGPKPGTGKIIATAKANGKPKASDKDVIKFTCNPSTGPTTTTTTLPPNCMANPAGGPDVLTLTVSDHGNDLDTGFTGKSHNFINVAGSQLKYCLTGCDASTNSVCQAAGSTGAGSLNGTAFGAPLPLFSAGVAVCVVNRFDPNNNQIQATVDVANGSIDATATPLVLFSDTYQGSSNQVCPRCVAGKCDSGRRQGQPCKVEGTVTVNNPPTVNNVKYDVSRDCLPSATALLGTPVVRLPLTTTETPPLLGNAAGNVPCKGQTKHDECGASGCTVDCSGKADPKGGINQTCCNAPGQAPCFPTANGGQLTRTGSTGTPMPAWPDPTYPKTADGTLAAVFCIDATGSITVDATAGLPGPGALLLSGTAEYSKLPQ